MDTKRALPGIMLSFWVWCALKFWRNEKQCKLWSADLGLKSLHNPVCPNI